MGGSWRPTAGVLGAVPLAVVSAALAGVSVVGVPGVSPGPAGVVPVRHRAAWSLGSVPFTTVTAGHVVGPKIPEGIGD